MRAIISFWEELLHKVHVDESMTMKEARLRDALYRAQYHTPGATEESARKAAMECPAEDLPLTEHEGVYEVWLTESMMNALWELGGGRP